MKKSERKFVEKSTCYAPPMMSFVVMSTRSIILSNSPGSTINPAEEEMEDIFG